VRETLGRRLAEASILVADGGMTTSLRAAGLAPGSEPEIWCLRRPDAVVAVHKAFLAAGADILTTNSFGANRSRYGDDAEAIATVAVRLVRRAMAVLGAPAVIAGSIGPVGPAHQRRVLFADQAAALASAGADVLWFETLHDRADAEAAREAARPTGTPYVLSFAPPMPHEDHEAILRFAAMIAETTAAEPRPSALGVNCGAGPETALRVIAAVAEVDLPLIARANAGLPELREHAVVYPFGPQEMAAFALSAKRLGARIVGGCCGVDAAAIAAIAETL
jgi:5-methyltetrahydrofolate--homocysteine methyltransferase